MIVCLRLRTRTLVHKPPLMLIHEKIEIPLLLTLPKCQTLKQAETSFQSVLNPCWQRRLSNLCLLIHNLRHQRID